MVHEAKLRRWTIFVRIAGQSLSAASNRIAKVSFLALACVAVQLRNAKGVIAARRRGEANADALVVEANVVFLGTILARGALHPLTAHQGIANEIVGARTFRLMLHGDTGGVHSADGRVVAAIATFGHAGHQHTRRRLWTILIAIVAHVRFVTAWMFIGVAHHVAWTFAAVAARCVLADGAGMTGVKATLVNVDTVHSPVVLEARFAATSSLAVANDACAMRTTIDLVAGVLAHEVDTLSVVRTIRVVQTLHLLAASLVVVRVTGEKANVGTLALHLMVGDVANCIRSAWVKGAKIDTL